MASLLLYSSIFCIQVDSIDLDFETEPESYVERRSLIAETYDLLRLFGIIVTSAFLFLEIYSSIYITLFDIFKTNNSILYSLINSTDQIFWGGR